MTGGAHLFRALGPAEGVTERRCWQLLSRHWVMAFRCRDSPNHSEEPPHMPLPDNQARVRVTMTQRQEKGRPWTKPQSHSSSPAPSPHSYCPNPSEGALCQLSKTTNSTAPQATSSLLHPPLYSRASGSKHSVTWQGHAEGKTGTQTPYYHFRYINTLLPHPPNMTKSMVKIQCILSWASAFCLTYKN